MKKTINIIIVLSLIISVFYNIAVFRAELYIKKGEEEKEKGLMKKSLVSYKNASEILPFNSSYQRLLGKSALELYEENKKNQSLLYLARYSYEKSIKLNSEYPYHWFELGKTFEMFRDAGIKETPMADIYYIKALEIDPTNPLFLSYLLNYQLKKGDMRMAALYFNRLADSYPPAISIHGKKFLKNESDFKKFAYAINNDSEKNIEFAKYLLSIGNKKYAEEQLEKVFDKDDVKMDNVIPISDILFGLGRNEEAKSLLLKAYERDTRQTYLLMKAAYIFIQEKDYQAAIKIYERILEKNPNQWSVHHKAGRLALKINNKGKASQHYYKALKLGPTRPKQEKEMHMALGKIQKENGNLETALEHYTKALEIDPNNKSLKKEIKNIKYEIEYLGH